MYRERLRLRFTVASPDAVEQVFFLQNGSPLFSGAAGSGESEIRRYIIGNDWLEAIIQLPTDLFYNTGISTYIWIINKGKDVLREGKVQLIDASNCYVNRRKNIGNKRKDLDENSRNLILKAYSEFTNKEYQKIILRNSQR